MPSSSPRAQGASRRRIVTMVATLASLALVIGLTLTACASGDGAVAEADSGGEATIAIGGTLEVALESDLSTDYVWLVSEIDPEMLIQAGESSFEAESDEAGAPGVETFYFEGVGSGTTALKLEYASPAELGEPQRTFGLTVNVE